MTDHASMTEDTLVVSQDVYRAMLAIERAGVRFVESWRRIVSTEHIPPITAYRTTREDGEKVRWART